MRFETPPLLFSIGRTLSVTCAQGPGENVIQLIKNPQSAATTQRIGGTIAIPQWIRKSRRLTLKSSVRTPTRDLLQRSFGSLQALDRTPVYPV